MPRWPSQDRPPLALSQKLQLSDRKGRRVDQVPRLFQNRDNSEVFKLAANYLAFIKLASIRIWLRANESTP
jgi:hypothetical protein